MEGQWLCYGGGQFNRGRMVMLQVGKRSGGHFNGGKMVTVTEVVSLMEGMVIMRWKVYLTC